MTAELLRLAERCEKETAGSRELDGRIWCALSDLEFVMWDGAGCVYRGRDGIGHIACDHVKEWTKSLDAAMSLVPEGWGWSVGDVHGPNETYDGAGMAWAEIWTRGENPVRIVSMGWVSTGFGNCGRNHVNAATPALALTAASLRARAAAARGE